MTKDHKKIKVSVHSEDIRTLAQHLFGFTFSRFSNNYMTILQDLNTCLEEKNATDVYQVLEDMQVTLRSLIDEIEDTAEILESLPDALKKEEEEKKL